MNSSLEEVVAGLTEAQLRAVKAASRSPLETLSPGWMKARSNTCEALVNKGIFRWGHHRWTGCTEYGLTSLGLAVRQHIEEKG